MRTMVRMVGIFAAVSLFAAPLYAFAALPGLPGSFGGTIIKVVPCIFPPASLLVTIRSARTEDFGFFKNYILTPGFTVVVNPIVPLSGGQMLGMADVPLVCKSFLRSFLFFSVFSFVPGERMTYVSISAPLP